MQVSQMPVSKVSDSVYSRLNNLRVYTINKLFQQLCHPRFSHSIDTPQFSGSMPMRCQFCKIGLNKKNPGIYIR